MSEEKESKGFRLQITNLDSGKVTVNEVCSAIVAGVCLKDNVTFVNRGHQIASLRGNAVDVASACFAANSSIEHICKKYPQVLKLCEKMKKQDGVRTVQSKDDISQEIEAALDKLAAELAEKIAEGKKDEKET